MNNCAEVTLFITVTPSSVRECLSVILHSILYNRSINNTQKPISTYSNELDLCYIKLDNYEVDSTITRSIKKLIEEYVQKGCKQIKMRLSFFTTRESKQFFLTKQQKVFFEVWTIKVHLQVPGDASPESMAAEEELLRISTAKQIQEKLFAIIETVNSKFDHLPPLPINQHIYQFTIESEKVNEGSSNDSKWLLSVPSFPVGNLVNITK
eukprot:Platyproteum_vivax@DN7025_c0_g1_i2.p1